MAWACREVGCALIGGETAQSPGLYASEGFDLAGTLIGAVEESEIINTARVREGDVLLGLPSSGLHTNGFSLVRMVFGIDRNSSVLYQHHEELGHTLGEELLIPHRCYYPLLEPHYPKLKAVAHITGGGVIGNLPRILPDGLAVQLRASAWEPKPIFQIIQKVGRITTQEMYKVFNMGLGMVMVCAFDRVASLQRALPEARVVGEVVKQKGEARVIIVPS